MSLLCTLSISQGAPSLKGSAEGYYLLGAARTGTWFAVEHFRAGTCGALEHIRAGT